jgi:hypothetical protein|tara:strand:+ start:425 stop:622 length:198 start_codon:yes stop_codon:yes gene_type:complete
MRILVTKYKKIKRKALHAAFLQETIVELNNGIVRDVISSDYYGDSLQNKAKLLKKYNRRLKWLLY